MAQYPLLGDRQYDRHFTADDYQPVLWAGTQSRNQMGILKVGPQQFRLQLMLKPEKNGSYSGTMVSLDQVATPIPFDKVERTSKRVTLKIKQLRGFVCR